MRQYRVTVGIESNGRSVINYYNVKASSRREAMDRGVAIAASFHGKSASIYKCNARSVA